MEMCSLLRFCVAILIGLSMTSAQACEPVNISDAMAGQKSKFKDLPSMVEAVKGTWSGCDAKGNTVKISVNSSGSIEGTMPRYGNSYRSDYTNCQWQASRTLTLPDVGLYNFSVRRIACSEDANAQDATHGDVGGLQLFGGRDTINYVVVEVKGTRYAVLKKTP